MAHQEPPPPVTMKLFTCRICGDEFEADARASNAAACSDECRTVMNKETYQRWLEKRRK